MPDVFGSSAPKFGGAFSVDETTLTFDTGGSGNGGLGTMVQSVSGNYARPIQRIFDLGPDKRTYYVVGRSEGGMEIQRLAAPEPIATGFIEKFSDPCRVETNTMSIDTRPEDQLCNNQQRGFDARDFSFCLIGNLSFGVSVQQIALTEGLQMMFASMSKRVTR